MKYYILTLLLTFDFCARGQIQTINVDSLVSTISTTGIFEPDDLADKITSQLQTDSLKVRAIYYWITQKVAYDCESFKKGNPIQYKGDNNDYYYKRVRRTISNKKGVCEDYAQTFKMLCNSLKIEAEVISGFGLTSKPYKILTILPETTSGHAWNAVKINNKWYLLDLTWASGYVDQTVSKFTRKRNDHYYLTDPKQFILDHHPVEDKWQLLTPPLTMSEFIKNARYMRNIE